MTRKILLAVICLCSYFIFNAQPVFKFDTQSIELNKLLLTSDDNAATIDIGGIPASVDMYRFQFSTSLSFPEYCPSCDSTGWWIDLLPGSINSNYILRSIPKLEVQQAYYVRVLYKSGGTWYGPGTIASFNTVFLSGYFNFANRDTFDLYQSLAITNDQNDFYNNYRFEFSRDSNFTEYTAGNSYSPPNWFLEVNNGHNNAPNVGAASALAVDSTYYVRVRVKTTTMTSWSNAGQIRSFHTINGNYFQYANNSNVDLFGVLAAAQDNNSHYSNYRFEFSRSPSFPEYASNPSPTGWYVETSGGIYAAPNIGAVDSLVIDSTYYIRVRVKTGTMPNWSNAGEIRSFHTINTLAFNHCGGVDSVDIKQTCLTLSNIFYYANYRYEFCTDSTFPNSSTHPVLVQEGLYNQSNCPLIHTALPSMLYSTVYYARIRVKTAAMQNWSTPGPLCSFTTAACVPDPGYCPTYTGACNYVPVNYYSFDNDCHRASDCINSQELYTNSNTIASSYIDGKVGKGFSSILIGTSGNTGMYEFPTSYPGNYNGDYTVEFGFKLGYDNNFIMYSTPVSGDFTLPHVSISSNNITITLKQNPLNSLVLYLTGSGVLSSSYYFDYKWHHAAMKYDSHAKLFELFMDGHSPQQFKLQLDSVTSILPPQAGDNYHFWVRSAEASHDLDELAFFDKALPGNVIYQHYQSFISHNHYNACNIDTTVIIPPGFIDYDITAGDTYDSLEYVPGYGMDILLPGKQRTYYHSDLVSLPSTSSQIQTFPLARYKPGHGLNPNINWTDTKYLGLKYSGAGSSLSAAWDPANDTTIQLELCKNWNYMYALSRYNDPDQNTIINQGINSKNQYKLSLISNINQWAQHLDPDNYITDIHTSDLDLNAPQIPVPTICGIDTTVTEFTRPSYTDGYKLYGRMLFKEVVKTYIDDPLLYNYIALTHKIDFVSDNSFESRIAFYPNDSECIYGSDSLTLAEKNALTVAPSYTPASWNDYTGYMAGRYYKAYADALINDGSVIFSGKKSSDIFNFSGTTNNTKFLFYLISSIAGQNSNSFENYNTKRICNTPYLNNSNVNYYSTPNFYPWTGPYGWYASGGPYWGLGLAPQREYEVSIGDQMYAPFVSARWSRDVNCMRPGQYLGYLKGLAMYGVDFFHAGYFNVTGPGGKWDVKKYSGDLIGFANDPRTWVWQLASASYVQANSSRFESIIRDCDVFTSNKFGNEFYIINKSRSANKYIVYATMQTISNIAGSEVLEKNISLNTFNTVIPNFKVNARRQGSTYILDMSNSPPVFYQLDKWHEYSHPGYWSKDFDFEAEVDDSGNALDLVTELPTGAAPGDYTDFTTAVKLTPSSNSVKYIFTPRDLATANNNYQVWLRMKSVAHNRGKAELKLNGSNLYTVDSITAGWKWYAYETCGCFPLAFYNLPATDQTLTISSGDSILIDRVYIRKDLDLNWETPVVCAESGCAFNYRAANYMAAKDSILSKKRTVDYTIDVRPNPMSGSCIIYSEGITADKEYLVRLINALGVEVKKMRIVNTSKEIELQTGELPNGFYSLVMTENKSLFKTTKKIIVQH